MKNNIYKEIITAKEEFVELYSTDLGYDFMASLFSNDYVENDWKENFKKLNIFLRNKKKENVNSAAAIVAVLISSSWNGNLTGYGYGDWFVPATSDVFACFKQAKKMINKKGLIIKPNSLTFYEPQRY